MRDDLLARVEKPARYIGGEVGAVRKDGGVEVRVALAFPDLYEVGMSHLGYQILYTILNGLPWCGAERVYAPWPDMDAELRARGLPLFALESGDALADFDLLGFTLQYELAASGVLRMLDLAGLPLRAAERRDGQPLVIAGGPCAANPEPWAPFFDALFIGEAEGAIVEIATVVRDAKRDGLSRAATVERLAGVEGIYLPHRRIPRYVDGRLAGFDLAPGEPERVRRRIVADLDQAPAPRAVLPHVQAVHDRHAVEVMRGCLRGCRFCQAGYLYRPVRERSAATVIERVRAGLRQTGHHEVSFLSLSSGDWTPVQTVLPYLMRELAPVRVAMSLPSLRVESLEGELAAAIGQVRRTGFTIAPEAATERLRRVINKPIDDAAVLASAQRVFEAGWELLKLYFMIGLPTETTADVEAIASLVARIHRVARAVTGRARLNVSIGLYVPKAHTPFERMGMAPPEVFRERLTILKHSGRGVAWKPHDADRALLEAVIARGDRRVGEIIAAAHEGGARFDGWTEHFNIATWHAAAASVGLDLVDLAARSFADQDALPWDGVDIGVAPAFLLAERDRALAGETTDDCRVAGCLDCGVCGEEIQVRRAPVEELPPRAPVVVADERHRYWLGYRKEGPARWLGHLDMVTAFVRAVRRAGLPLAYTGGFHPTPRVAFGPPLSLGVAAADETVELGLTEPLPAAEVVARLAGTLPAGLVITGGRHVDDREPSVFDSVTGWDFEADLSRLPAADYAPAVAAFLAAEAWPVAIARKGRTHTVDARALVETAEIADATLHLRVRSTREAALRPNVLVAQVLGLTDGEVPTHALTRRKTVLR